MKFIKILFLFICLSGFSQTKVGTIDIDFILSKMPELTDVQKQVDDYAKTLDVDFNAQVEAYKVQLEAYKQEEAGLTIAQKQEKQQALLALENDLNKFQQNGVQLVGLKRDEFLRPLYTKIGVALEKIAKAENYTQVLQLDETVVYLDPNFDLTLKVLAELGITVAQE